MNLYLRLLMLWIKMPWLPKLSNPLDIGLLRMRVLPNDLDIYLHMNNGRYLSIMDLGRFYITVKTGLLKLTVKNQWAPLLGSVKIHFLKPLTVFQKFELSTQVVYWDEKWFYIEQKIVSNEKLCAVALMKILFIGKEGKIAPQQIIERMPNAVERPTMPDVVKHWQAAENERKEQAS